jgi:hypothetical protein
MEPNMDPKIPPLASKQLEPLLTPLSDIKPHPDNYKIHTPEQLASLRASLNAFGCTQPIKVNLEGYIVAGHGMYQLYQEEGFTHAPVIYEALDKRLSKAYLVADNETARLAETDSDKLSLLLQDAAEIPDFDFEATGFELEDLDLMLEGVEKGSEEEAEEEAEAAVKEYVNLEKDSINIFHALAGEPLGCINRFNYLFSYTQGEKSIIKPFPKDSILFLDSGALAGVLKYGPEFVSLETQEKIVRYAEEMGAHWVTMLDIPMIPQVLEPLKKTKEEAYQIHIRNAKAFKEIQTDVRKVYVIQGPGFADFKRCCQDIKPLATDHDVIAIGSIKDRASDSELIVKITALVKSFFPNNDIHLFGVTKPESVARAVLVGATSCDSAAVSFATRTGGTVIISQKEDGSISTKSQSLTDYCYSDTSISQTGAIWMGATVTGMFNVVLAIYLAIQKAKLGANDESN